MGDVEKRNSDELFESLLERYMKIGSEYYMAFMLLRDARPDDPDFEQLKKAETELREVLTELHATALIEMKGDKRINEKFLYSISEQWGETLIHWVADYMIEVSEKLGESAGKTSEQLETVETELLDIKGGINSLIEKCSRT